MNDDRKDRIGNDFEGLLDDLFDGADGRDNDKSDEMFDAAGFEELLMSDGKNSTERQTPTKRNSIQAAERRSASPSNTPAPERTRGVSTERNHSASESANVFARHGSMPGNTPVSAPLNAAPKSAHASAQSRAPGSNPAPAQPRSVSGDTPVSAQPGVTPKSIPVSAQPRDGVGTVPPSSKASGKIKGAVVHKSGAPSATADKSASDRVARRRVTITRQTRGRGAPFITSGRPIAAIYADMLVATLPALIWAVFLFGVRCLAVIVCSVVASVVTELVLELIIRRRVTVSDLSAVWSGVTVGMLMPPAVALWVPMLASAVGIGVFKCALGGRGRTFLSPALGGVAAVSLLLGSQLSVYTAPFSRLSLLSSVGEGASYYLSAVPGAGMPSESIGTLFLGMRPGAIGEVSALMLLVGFAYLVARGVFAWESSLTFVGVAALLFYAFPKYSLEDRFLTVELLCGLIPICALVFAPDFACAPVFSTARFVYGALCGGLTVAFRYLGVGIYSAVYATLTAQLFSRLLDSLCIPKCFGTTVGARLFHTEADTE